MNAEELTRYNRHIILPEIGIEGQEKLKAAKVLVIGAGGLGCPALQYLTAAGVGFIGIVDGDIVDESNLHRQILYSHQDIGKLKTVVAREKLLQQNPFIEINSYPIQISNNNALELIQQYDIVIDGSDNFPTRYLINDACVILNKPVIFASIFKFEGQISVFNYNNGPTYRCLYPEPPSPGDVPNCSEIGVLGVLPGIIGCMQAMEAIKIITGIGHVLSGELLQLQTLDFSFNKIHFNLIPGNKKITELIDYEGFCGINKMKKEITAAELNALLKKEKTQLIDVREAYEYEICHLPNAQLIPLSELNNNISKIDRETTVVVYCHHGMRSANAIDYLTQQHYFSNLINLKGGIHAWATEIDKSMKTY